MLLRDLRLAWRLLAKEPGCYAVATIGLAVALAACVRQAVAAMRLPPAQASRLSDPIYLRSLPMSLLKSRLALRGASLLAAAVLALPATRAAASGIPDYPFVHVAGSAARMEMPDIATLDFEIVVADADPAAALALIRARAAEVQELLRQLDIDPDNDLGFRETRQTIRQGEKSADGGPIYELRSDGHIRVRELANWQKLAGGLFGKPNIDGFTPGFDLSTIDKVTDEMVAQAIQDARHRAEVIAQASGRRLGAVVAVTPDALKNLSTAMGLEREEFRAPRRSNGTAGGNVDRDVLLMVQVLKLRQAVDVIFRLENAAPARPARRP